MGQETVGHWEELPELVVNRQYVRCLDRLVRSLPRSRQRSLFRHLLPAAVSIGSGAACFHAALLNGSSPTPTGREVHRQRALGGIRDSREWLGRIRGVKGADEAELLVAGELLDRIEEMLREARPRGVS
ncbi:MAG: hypothetical protein KY466_13315 [Gemmatimonadetes bacterium]|nr:hypothetical protein [Gemmatimonadota bacterium]